MNIWDFIVLGILIVCFVFAVKSIYKKRKSGCCGSCKGCGNMGKCAKKHND